jgi:hypothetical protein
VARRERGILTTPSAQRPSKPHRADNLVDEATDVGHGAPVRSLPTRRCSGSLSDAGKVRRSGIDWTAIRRCERSDSGSSYASCQVAQYERVESFVAIGWVSRFAPG